MRLWDAVAPALAGRFRVLCVDLRGHGVGRASGPYALDDLCRRCAGAGRSFGLGWPFVAGASLGALTALRWPETPARIVGTVVCKMRTDVSPKVRRRDRRGATRLFARRGCRRWRRYGAVALAVADYARARRKWPRKSRRWWAGASAEGSIAWHRGDQAQRPRRAGGGGGGAGAVRCFDGGSGAGGGDRGMRARCGGGLCGDRGGGDLSPLENPDAVSAALVPGSWTVLGERGARSW